MSEMMQPSTIFKFGKHKGKTVMEVAEKDPGYLSWLRRDGFSGFGKEVTEAIFAWEEANPEEVMRIDRSIAKKKVEQAAQVNAVETHPPRQDHEPKPAASANLAWGSW